MGAAGYSVTDHVAFVEDKTLPVPANVDEKLYKAQPDFVDDEIDEVTWYKSVTTNRVADPGIAGCFNAAAPVFGPGASITEGAATPPADGFFDPSATYKGAFKDAADTWATMGKWAVWAEK